MPFNDYLDKTATIRRLTATVGNKTAYTVVGSASCRLEMLDPETVQQIEGQFTKSFRIFVDNTANILDGDQVEIDSEKYIVKGVQDIRDGSDAIHHRTIILEKG